MTYPTLRFKEIRVSLKTKRTSLWNFVLNSGLKNSPLNVDRRKVLSTKLVDGRALLTAFATVDAPWLDRRCYTLTAHKVYYTSVDRDEKHRSLQQLNLCTEKTV